MPPWQKGKSGNPNPHVLNQGAYQEARRICALASPEAARIQVLLMNDDDSRVRFVATEAVLNRGAGKPRDHSADETGPRIDLSGLTEEELQSLGQLLRKALGLDAPAGSD